MVKSAVTDIVSPAVAAEDPLALLGEVVLSCEDLANDAVLCRALLKSAYQLLGSSCVCLAVVLSSEILVDECLSVIMSDLACFLQLLLNSLSQSVLVVYGVDGSEPAQIEEQPVAFAMYILSPNS